MSRAASTYPSVHLRIMTRFGIAVFFATCIGCPGTLDDPARFLDAAGAGDAVSGADAGGSEGGSCPDVPQDVFRTTCTSSGCHNAQDKAQGLDLQSANAPTRLVGVRATEGAGLLIDP